MILCIFWDFVSLMYVKAPWGVLREKGKPIFPQVLVYMYYWTLDVTSLYSLHHNILLWMSQKNKKDSRSEQGGEIMGNTYSAKDMGQEQHQPVVST